jgi:alkylation response protein AidB-like acyl-CoA dehydrogenase
MDFSLSDQQRLLVTVARDVLEKHCPPILVQALALDARGFRDDLWTRVADLGWPGLLVPADLGGSEASLTDVMLLVEEMGRACFPGPYIPSAVVATTAIVAAGTAEQRARWLPPMALGERLTTMAIAEEEGSFAPGTFRMTLGAGQALSGTKLFVKDAHLAHDLVVAVRDEGGVTLAMIDTGRRGVQVIPLDTMSGEKLFAVVFTDVAITPHDVLGQRGLGAPALASALSAGALARTAEMVGAAQKILDLAVDYAKVRVQSGRPIGAFQAIQHRCADLLRNVEASRAMLHHAVWKAEHGVDDGASAMAKAYGADACLGVARRAHQIFGAIGYCEEHPLHLLHKRIHAAAMDYGDRVAQLESVARSIGLR